MNVRWSVVALGLLVACGGGGGKKKGKYSPQVDGEATTTTTGQGLVTQSWDSTSDSDGFLDVDVDVDDGVTQFMVTGSSDAFVYLESLTSPSGDTVLESADWQGKRSLTGSMYGDTVAAFNWPIRDEDGPLEEGTWTVLMSTVDSDGFFAGGQDVGVTVQTKPDPDLSQGTIRVAIVYADGVDADPELIEAVEGAVERWRSVWASRGLTLQESWWESDLPADLSFTYDGSEEIRELSETAELMMIIGEQVLDESGTFGISAGVPGTMTRSPKTFVVISWLVHAGVDGVLSNDEITIMGETMAHEGGHYLGLFHPVEFSYDDWDAISDTPECASETDCDETLGTNLMYPYPVCDYYYTSCVKQDQLTDGQTGVWQRYIGTL